jgi:hypothetical protein
MPTKACAAVASQERMIQQISSENYAIVAKILTAFTALFSDFPRTPKVCAPNFFSTPKSGSNSLVQNGHAVIGTTSPQTPLQIGSDLAFTNNWAQIDFNMSGNTAKYLTTNYAAAIGIDYTAGGLTFNTAPLGTAGTAVTDVPRMFISSTGNVGIGFTSPFFLSPIASIAEAAQPTFPDSSWQVKCNQNPAYNMAATAAARNFDYHSHASPYQKAA